MEVLYMYARTPVLAISYRDVPIIGSGKNTLQERRAGIRGGDTASSLIAHVVCDDGTVW